MDTYSKRGNPARIAREAEVLAVARHPGVVTLIGIEGDPRQPVLVTEWLEGPDLAGAGALSRAETAGVMAAVASTIADLHGAGVVHGAVAPEHVILVAGGRPVLCSFGYGGRTGETSPERPVLPQEFLDPGHAEGDPLDPTIDVYALGALLRFLIPETPESSMDPLLGLADEATAGDPRQRPAASRLASLINEAVPEACLPGTSVPGDLKEAGPRPLMSASSNDALVALRRSQRPPLRGYAATRKTALVTGVIVLAAGAAWLGANRLSSTGSDAAAPALTANPTIPSVAPTEAPVLATTTTSTTTTTTVAPVVSAPLEPLRYSGGILESGSQRWSVGTDGDQVVTGDWSCRGTIEVALLRPATGEVFVFDGWARPDQDLVATPVIKVDGGFALRSANLATGTCQHLVVDRRDAPPVVVPIRPLGPGE